jgi:hypothetical protein
MILHCKDHDRTDESIMEKVKSYPEHKIGYPYDVFSPVFVFIVPTVYKCKLCGQEALVATDIHWIKEGESILERN